MTNEEIAALSLAVHLRNALLIRLDRHDLDPGDGFPQEWRDRYAEALRGRRKPKGVTTTPRSVVTEFNSTSTR